MTTEVLAPEEMSPEGTRVIEAYFNCGSDVKLAAKQLGMSDENFIRIYKRPEVRNYINSIFYESGFRNRNRFFDILDEVLNKKLMELEETGMGSSMDIMDILSKMHSMKMAEMKAEAELRKLEIAKAPVHQTNIQNNFPGSQDPGYMQLMQKLGQGKYK